MCQQHLYVRLFIVSRSLSLPLSFDACPQVILKYFTMANGAIYVTTNGMRTKLKWSAGNWVSMDTRELRTAAGSERQDVRTQTHTQYHEHCNV